MACCVFVVGLKESIPEFLLHSLARAPSCLSRVTTSGKLSLFRSRPRTRRGTPPPCHPHSQESPRRRPRDTLVPPAGAGNVAAGPAPSRGGGHRAHRGV